MEQVLSEEVQGQEEVWVEVVDVAEWVEIVRDQDPVETVFARSAAKEYNISEECLVIQQIARSVERKW